MSELQEMCSDYKKGRVLCVGMCVLDIIHVCEEYPVEDTDKRCLNGYWQRGGNASNNCTVLRKLGVECEFLGMLSSSNAFSFLLEDCHDRGIHIEHCPSVSQNPPFSSVILVQATGTRTIVHSNPNFPILRYEHFRNLEFGQYNWIHFEARNPEETLCMLNKIHAFNASSNSKNNIQISVELEKVREENLVLASHAHYIFLGKDLSLHLGWKNSKDAVFGMRKTLNENLKSDKKKPAIICTWGGQGSSCLDPNDNYSLLPAEPVKNIVDSLGAGDTFCAATIYAILELKMDLPAAVAFGNRCASFKLGHRGYDEIEQLQKEK